MTERLSDEDLKVQACGRELQSLLEAHAIRRRFFTAAFVAEVAGVVKQYGALAKRQGVRWPDMVVVWSDRYKFCEVFRCDMEEAGIKVAMANLAVKYRIRGRAGARELTRVFLRAYPSLGGRADVEAAVDRAEARDAQR